MDTQEESLLQVANALPQNFEFYHLGKVTLQPAIDWNLQDVCAIAYHLAGDVKALMIVLFQKDLDMSVYSELGNVLASKAASSLSQQGDLDWMISPPQVLNELQYSQLMRDSKISLRRAYTHQLNQVLIPVEMIILPASHEGIGNA